MADYCNVDVLSSYSKHLFQQAIRDDAVLSYHIQPISYMPKPDAC